LRHHVPGLSHQLWFVPTFRIKMNITSLGMTILPEQSVNRWLRGTQIKSQEK